MSCNGNNHGSNCTCGWGGVWYGNLPYGGGSATPAYTAQDASAPLAISFHRLIRWDKPASRTYNAKCPRCGEPVFFYENEYGSRVFFDALGPPWPKHPCTDNSTYIWRNSARVVVADRAPHPHRKRRVIKDWTEAAIVQPIAGLGTIAEVGVDDTVLILELDAERLAAAIPLVHFQLLSEDYLRLCYFHTGVRDEIIRDIGFARAPKMQGANSSRSSVEKPLSAARRRLFTWGKARQISRSV